MKKLMTIAYLFALGAFTLLPFANTAAAQKASKVSNAQNAMIALRGPANLINIDNQVWKFEELSAAIANHDYNLCNPATSGRGNGNACRAAALSAARDAKCNYWSQDGHPFWTIIQQITLGEPFPITIQVDGDVLGESLQIKDGRKKYSFSLDEPLVGYRVAGLSWSLVERDALYPNGGGLATFTPDHVADYDYQANAGPNGDAATAAQLLDGSVAATLAYDGFANNDSQGADVARINPISITIPGPGHYAITVLGTVKGVNGGASLNLVGKQNVHISAESCQN